MKTLIESTESSATYKFTHDTATRIVTYTAPEDSTQDPDFEAMATEDHQQWVSWLGIN